MKERSLDGKFIETHGLSRTPEYDSWKNMVNRCHNPLDKNYKNYGKRGIRVCDEWFSLLKFIEDMGKRPNKEYTLDRIDVNGNYERSNCRWATHKQQMRNVRYNMIVEWKGKRRLLIELIEESGLPYQTVWSRYKMQEWSLERSLTEPLQDERIEYQGNKYNIKSLAELHGLNRTTLDARLNTYGWTLERALNTPVGGKH
jgi:hypothetical protein